MCNHHAHLECKMDAETKAIHERRNAIQVLAAGGMLTVSAGAMSGCATNPETGEKQFIGLASESQLNSMALSSWNEMRQKIPTSNDPRYTRRLANIGSRVKRGANRADQKWDYAVFDKDQKNAFVLPGNRVGFYKGMMDFADNDDQIAAVMGHEVGHVSGRHARERVSQQMLGQTAIGLGTVIGGSQMSKKCNSYRTAAQAAKTREQYNAAKVGYQKLWEKMAEASPSRQPEFMSTHPDPDKRAAKLRDYIALQERLGSQGWESIKMPCGTGGPWFKTKRRYHFS